MADTFDDGVAPDPDAGIAGAIPWHFWAIAAVALLWNGYGAWDYTSYQLGLTPAIAAVDAAPVWATTCWALGVWAKTHLIKLIHLQFPIFQFPLYAILNLQLIRWVFH